ncbi:MAG: TonB-dependent receptor [Bacteroidia bacterium]|nr:TonB-dependent receptor [Bacteroidia bacterium]
MKLKIHLLILILTLTCTLKAQEKYIIPWDYKDLSFKEFVIKAESQFNIKFLYKDEWVKDLKLGDYSGCTSLSCVLDNLFKSTLLYYFIDDSENVVITKDFAVNVSNETIENGNILKPMTDHKVYKEDQQIAENAFVEIGNRNERNKPGKVTISGYVTNMETGNHAAGVTVFIKNLSLGTITNEFGFYTLTLPRGFHEIQFSFIGVKEKKINLNLYGSGELNVDLNRSIINLKEIIVSAKKNITLERSEVGVEKINIKTFKLLPTSMGEVDLMKSIILIPGVQSVGEGSAGFNVRGGSADQNLILLYGAPIYNSSHFFGFFSSVNSDIIKDVTLYKGGIPSRYGGRISSVLDIESKEGNNKEFAGNIGISPITTHLIVEGPLIKDTLSYLLTARTTYSNWIFDLIKNPLLHNNRASFYDMNGKITYDLNKNNKLDASYYLSHDYFRFNLNMVYSYDNNILALRWLHFYNSKFSSALSISNSFYKYNILNQDVTTEAYFLSHQINNSQFKADFNWLPGSHKINFGLDVNKYAVMPGSYRPASDSSLIMSNVIERERAFEGALYIDDKFFLTDFLSVNVGMRMSSFFSLGPQTVFKYSPGFSKSKSTITDTINFMPGEFPSKYAGPELRASLNFRITDKNSIKINYNRTRQYLHLLSNSTSISPTDTWKLCDYYLNPEVGDQYAIGFYQMLFKNSFETSAELYYKEIKNMVDFKGGSTLTMVDDIEQYMINVKGKAYGMELAIKKIEGKTRFSIGYTYARTFAKSTSNFKDEIINSGNWYPANYDKPNNLVITYQYLYSRRFSFSADYTYSTGRPITLPIAIYHVNDILMVQYSDRNKYRIPDYSRLDVSFKVSGNLRSHKIAHPNLTFSVYNLFGKENAYSVYFQKEKETIKGYKLSVFVRPIPSVTFSFDF